jgi:hypothetical protein
VGDFFAAAKFRCGKEKKNALRKMYFCNSCSSIYEQVPRTGSSRFFFQELPAGEKIIFHLPA